LEKIICDKCDGKGIIHNKDSGYICPKCLGEKELDWVENIVGKDKSKFNGNITSSSVSYVGGGGSGGASCTWNNTQGFSIQCIGGGGGGSNGVNKQYVDDDNVKIKIDSQYKQVIKDELLEQIIDKMDEMIKTRVQIELIKRGIK